MKLDALPKACSNPRARVVNLSSIFPAILLMLLITPSLWAMVSLTLESGASIEEVEQEQIHVIWRRATMLPAVYICGAVFFGVPVLVRRTIKTVSNPRRRLQILLIPGTLFAVVCIGLLTIIADGISRYLRYAQTINYEGIIDAVLMPLTLLMLGGALFSIVNYTFGRALKRTIRLESAPVRIGLVLAVPILLLSLHSYYAIATLHTDLLEHEKILYPHRDAQHQDHAPAIDSEHQQSSPPLPPDQPSK